MESRGERNARAACRPWWLRNENTRGSLRYGPSGSERTGCSDRWCSERGCTWGSQVAGLGGIFYRAVRESVTSATGGTRDVPNKGSVEKIRCRVERVGALQDLGVRHAMKRL